MKLIEDLPLFKILHTFHEFKGTLKGDSPQNTSLTFRRPLHQLCRWWPSGISSLHPDNPLADVRRKKIPAGSHLHYRRTCPSGHPRSTFR